MHPELKAQAIVAEQNKNDRSFIDPVNFYESERNSGYKNTGNALYEIIDNAYGILGIELMAAAQALDFREYSFGAGVEKAKEVIRKYVDFLDIDRPLYPDHDKMKELVKSCEILEEVEKIVGSLE